MMRTTRRPENPMPTSKSGAPGALFQFLLGLPPAIGPVVAIVIFVALRFGVAALLPASDPSAQDAAQTIATVIVTVSQKAAPLLAAAIVFVWAFTLLHRLFDTETPPRQ
jgi:hypothetical protein